MRPSPPPTDIRVRLPGRVDGLFLAPINPANRWTALRNLRNGMAELRRLGLAPRLTYVLAVSSDGRIVPARNDDAVLYLLAYRFGPTA